MERLISGRENDSLFHQKLCTDFFAILLSIRNRLNKLNYKMSVFDIYILINDYLLPFVTRNTRLRTDFTFHYPVSMRLQS